MPEQDPIEQRIVEIEKRLLNWSEREQLADLWSLAPFELRWLITQVREALAALRKAEARLSTYDDCLEQFDVETFAALVDKYENKLNKVEQERDAERERADCNWQAVERIKGRWELSRSENKWLKQERDALFQRVETYHQNEACDGSIERSFREASRVAIDALWGDSPEHIYESPAQVIEWLRDERLRLKQERDEARRDSERLDWLTSCGDLGTITIDSDLIGESRSIGWSAFITGSSPRAAIDAAMAVSKAEPDMLK